MTRDAAWAAQPFWRYALIGSLALHLAALGLLAQVRISGGAREPRTLGSRIPIELFTPPKSEPRPVAVVRAAPPPPKPQPIVAPRPRRETEPKPPAARPATPTPSRPAPRPSHASPPSGGGGAVGLGTLAPGGDLRVPPSAGSGGTPVGSVPGNGTGSGSGTGPGRGDGPPGTAEPKPNPGPTPPPPPKPEPPKTEPKPPEHHSTLADRAIPELVQRVNPAYPLTAKEDGVEGTVRLRLRVETDGSVSQVHVTKSAGDGRLDDAAASAVKRWKYKPAVQNGVPRAVETVASVTFRLQ